MESVTLDLNADRDMKSLYLKCDYDGKVKAYRPGILATIICFTTKKEAMSYASAIGWTKNSVEPVASRFSGKCWGLMGGGMGMFLKDPFYRSENYTKLRCNRIPTPEEMIKIIDSHFKQICL